MRIRMAGLEDAAALLAIYAPYVRETAITFEYDVPSEKEFAGRIAHTLEKFPYLVAENDGEIVGYAYAGAFHQCGYKFDTWYDMVWMEKHIGEHVHPQPPILGIKQIEKEAGEMLSPLIRRASGA